MSIKDKLVQTAARKALEGKLKRYGSVRSLLIDTTKRSVILDFLPLGEPESIIVSLAYRDVSKEGDGFLLKIERAESNRLWLNHLLMDFATDLELPVKGAAGWVLKGIL